MGTSRGGGASFLRSLVPTDASDSPLSLLRLAVVVRLTVVLLLATSSSILPDFVGTDDSLVEFPLRLYNKSKDGPTREPFALEGSICEGHGSRQQQQQQAAVLTRFWTFLLTPLTRWDAARFLSLAHDPSIRRPLDRFQEQLARADGKNCPNNWEQLLRESYEAHPFLPLFPVLVQYLSILLCTFIPHILLPPTCEGVVVLAALWINTLCFCWASFELYSLTETVLGSCKDREGFARNTALCFVFNPALVFFATSYSESLGAALIFCGCRQFAMMQQKRQGWNNRLWYFLACVLLWWLSCWVRSNGSLYAGFLILSGLGRACSRSHTIIQRALLLGLHLGAVFLMIYGSLRLHNALAFQNHCTIDLATTECEVSIPEWCHNGPHFNLYSYVQAKYWNVGLFKYYQWKQLPNFLLATPVLFVSTHAAASWIRQSWNVYRSRKDNQTKVSLSVLIRWAIVSLQQFPQGSIAPDADQLLLGDNSLLGHYAVLAASVLLALTVAHVQIATRMICSTCPALYWFAAVHIRKGGLIGKALMGWSLLYLLLGIIMHPNWLPWT